MATLKELRDQRSMTREQLAVASGVSYPTLARLEAGSKPRVDMAINIAEALGVPVEDIEWGVKPDTSTDVPKDARAVA